MSSEDLPPTGRITGLGGVFFKARDPGALANWYREMLGIGMEGWDGAMFAPVPDGPPFQLWSPFGETSDYFAPSEKPFMINFAVDDLDAFLGRLTARGIEVLKRDDSDPNGSFAWILDPEGTKLEFWQPKAADPA